MHSGSCLCGKIKFEVTGDLPYASACHCIECRKHSGHYYKITDSLPQIADPRRVSL